jgi:hypothetical protein
MSKTALKRTKPYPNEGVFQKRIGARCLFSYSHKLATYLSKWLASCGDGRIVPQRLLFIKKSATLEGEEMGLSLERMDVMLDDNEIDDEGRLHLAIVPTNQPCVSCGTSGPNLQWKLGVLCRRCLSAFVEELNQSLGANDPVSGGYPTSEYPLYLNLYRPNSVAQRWKLVQIIEIERRRRRSRRRRRRRSHISWISQPTINIEMKIEDQRIHAAWYMVVRNPSWQCQVRNSHTRNRIVIPSKLRKTTYPKKSSPDRGWTTSKRKPCREMSRQPKIEIMINIVHTISSSKVHPSTIIKHCPGLELQPCTTSKLSILRSSKPHIKRTNDRCPMTRSSILVKHVYLLFLI